MMRKIGGFIWGKIFVLFFRPLYALENTKFVWTTFVNRNAVRFYKGHARPLSPVEKRIADELDTKGIVVTSLEELFGNGEERLKELIDFAGYDKRTGEINKLKPYIADFIGQESKISSASPFTKAALDEGVLSIVQHYMWLTPKLEMLFAQEIKSLPEGADRSHSMRWHRDPHDIRRLKMFIYMNDVGPEQGPFTYLKKSNYNNKYWKVFPHVPPAGIYPPQGVMEKLMDEGVIDKNDLFQATGKAGSVIFADTSGLHYGGFVVSGSRRMSTAGFLAPKSFEIKKQAFEEVSGGMSLSPLQKYVATVNENLPSRNLYIFLKSMLMGKESVGAHITGMKM